MVYLMIGVFIYAWMWGAMFVAYGAVFNDTSFLKPHAKYPHLWSLGRAGAWPYDVLCTIIAALRGKK